MANLVDTSVNGDLRVTGTMFGTQAGNYATCATAAGTAAKAVTISGFTLTTGIHVFVKFTVTNTAAVASLTLNVSGTGAKAMKYRGGNLPAVGTLSASRVYEFIYDGTNWELVGDLDTNTQTVTGVKGNAESSYRTGQVNLTAANIGASASDHTHGNIGNGGTLTDTAAAAAGNDYVVIRDADNNKVQTSTIKGTDVADAVSKKHSHSTLTLSTTAQAYDGTHTLALPSSDPYTSARTPTSHTHGNIANGGTLTDTAAAAAGNDYVVIRDADNNKVQTSTIKGTDVADAVSKKHSHSTLTLSTTAQAYDGSHTLALPSTDPYTSARTPTSHTHGNITNGGALQTNDITIASGDKLVVTDSSDSSKVARTSVSFDGSTTTTALTPKGTFEAFAKSGDITTAIQALDVSSVGGDGKYISAISETDGKISATATTMDTTPTASSTKAVTSGGIKTALDGKVSKSGDTMTGRLTLEKPLSQVIIGTGTAASSSGSTYYPAKWNFDLGIATPTAGDQLVIKMPTAGHDNGVYMSTDNGTTYFPVARHTGASRLTTHYPNGAYIHLVYETYVTNSSASGQVDSIFPVAGGTARVSQKIGCWRVINDYDSGNDYACIRTENGRFYAGSTGCNQYSLVCLDKDGKYSMLVSSGSGTGTAKTINTAGKFRLGASIIYYAGNNTAANTLVGSTYATFWTYHAVDTRYSHNYTTAFTTHSPLYIECTIDADGYWSPTEKCITQTLVAGRYYIYLGLTYSTAYQLSLSTDHPVYYYDGTNLVDYTFGIETMYDARYARYDTAGDGWVRLAHTEEKSRTNSDVIAEWDVAYSTAGGGVYHEKLFLGVRFNSSGKGVLNQFWRRYVNNNTGVVKFAVKVTGVGGSGNTSVELWAFLTKAWNGLTIKQVAGNGYALNRYRTAWFYESYDSVGGTTKPVEDTANNIYVYDPTNQTVAIGSFLPLAGGTMTGKINAWASQYTDDGTTGAIDMKNSNIVGLNSLYTADASDGASEGIHFFRESGKYDTLWMAGGHMYFVPNRAVGTSTSAADSKKVAILPASITSNQMVVTDGTSGDVKGVDAYTGRGVIAAVGLADGRRNRGNATGDGWGKIASITKSSGIASTNISSVWSIVCNTSSTNSVYILRINIRGTSGSLPSTQLCKLYGNDDFDTTRFGIKLVIRGTSASSVTAEIWACTSKNYTGIAISELAGGEMEMGNTRKWTYYTVSGGGEAAPVADATNNVQVVDPVIDTYSWNHFYNGYKEVTFDSSVTVATFLSNAQTTNSFANMVFGAGLTDTALLTINAIGRLNISNNTNIQTELENLGSYPMFHVVATRQAGYVEFEGSGKKVRYHFGTSGALTNKYYEFVKLNNSVSATPSFYAPTSGGTANYVLIGNGTTSAPTWVEKAPKAVVADYVHMLHTNEVNFKNVPTSGNKERVWFNYRNGDTDAADADNKVTGYFFGNRNGVTTGVTLYADNFTGTSTYATNTKVTTATTTKTYLAGATATGYTSGAQTSLLADTGVYLTTTAGELNATQYKVNEHCTMKYNSTKSSLDFTFS